MAGPKSHGFYVDTTGRKKKGELPQRVYFHRPVMVGLTPPTLPTSTEGEGKKKERTNPKKKLAVCAPSLLAFP